MCIRDSNLATEWIFKDGRALTAGEIGEFLRTKASVSAHERGYQYLCETISQNANKFLGGDAPVSDVWGRLEDDDTAIVIRKVFDSICADGGYNAQALLSWLAQNNYLQTSKPHLTKTVRINNIPTRCVVLRLPQLENDDFEPLGYIPD